MIIRILETVETVNTLKEAPLRTQQAFVVLLSKIWPMTFIDKIFFLSIEKLTKRSQTQESHPYVGGDFCTFMFFVIRLCANLKRLHLGE